MSSENPPPPNDHPDREQNKRLADECGTRRFEENQKRYEWIAVAAYFKAEKRGFAPGHALDDWLEAESEHTKIQVEDFLRIRDEDGAPTMLDLQTLAKSVGIPHPESIRTKTDLIQAIQGACQLLPCFRVGTEDHCKQFPGCQWRSECKKLIAEWMQHEKHL